MNSAYGIAATLAGAAAYRVLTGRWPIPILWYAAQAQRLLEAARGGADALFPGESPGNMKPKGDGASEGVFAQAERSLNEARRAGAASVAEATASYHAAQKALARSVARSVADDEIKEAQAKDRELLAAKVIELEQALQDCYREIAGREQALTDAAGARLFGDLEDFEYKEAELDLHDARLAMQESQGELRAVKRAYEERYGKGQNE